VAGAGYGVAMLVALAATPILRHWSARLLVLAVMAMATIAIVLWVFPECRNGPYGNLDADLAAILFPQIAEAQSLWTWVSQQGPEIALVLPPLTGTAILLVVTALVPVEQRWRWLVLSGFSLVLFVVFCLQIRGYRLLTIALVPGSAWLAVRLWEWFRARRTLAAAAITGVALSGLSGAMQLSAFTFAYTALVPETPLPLMINWEKCLKRESFAPLAALPPGRLMSFMLIGAPILLETPHAIVAAGYHRNEAGLRDLIRFYGGGEAEARSVASERDLDYLVFCNGLPASGGLAGLPDFEGTSWPWLVRISAPDAPLQIYAIE
jgi:hypothetical protein